MSDAAPPQAWPPTPEAAPPPRRTQKVGLLVLALFVVAAGLMAVVGAALLFRSVGSDNPEFKNDVPYGPAPLADPRSAPSPVLPAPSKEDGIVPTAAKTGPENAPRREELRVLLKDVISVVDRLNSYGKTVEDLFELARDPEVLKHLERMKSEPAEPPAPVPD